LTCRSASAMLARASMQKRFFTVLSREPDA
jgi:hypothetical protein